MSLSQITPLGLHVITALPLYFQLVQVLEAIEKPEKADLFPGPRVQVLGSSLSLMGFPEEVWRKSWPGLRNNIT